MIVSKCISSLGVLLIVSVFVSAQQMSPARVTDLRCEYLVEPLGIDASTPRFTWRIEDQRQGARQTAFEIVMGTDSAAVSAGNGSSWKSGKVSGDRQLTSYAGDSLLPFTQYFWTVFIWDQEGNKSAAAPVSNFETGMRSAGNWQGAWISDALDIHAKPAPYFRKRFSTTKEVKRARVYIAAAGLYELSVNGQTIGGQRLNPTYTRFDRRILYVVHDVTAHVAQSNAISVILGNGWYNHQSTAVWDFHKAPWRARPAFCLDLRIDYTDGTTEIIATGKDWKTSTGEVVFNSIYTAEHHDARLLQAGWNTPDFDDGKWQAVTLRSAPAPLIVAQTLHPVRDVKKIGAKTINRINDTVAVIDFGQNISGVTSITVSGESGTVLRLKHAERLYPNGRADQSNIDVHYRPTDNMDPFQTDIYILKGVGHETFKPKFNYKGFQFVEIASSKPVKLDTGSVTAYFMHSDVPPIGRINSSSDLINRLWSATNNSYLSNLFGYPTDCPQREKNGWTGDAHIASETGLFNFDAITVYEKWMADHRDEQQPNGVLPSIIPTGGWGYEWGNGPDWTSTIILIPWNIYLYYGDTTLLAQCYDNMKRYVNRITAGSNDGLTSWGLGDWVPVKSKTPVEFTSSAYYYTDAKLLAQIASILGKKDDHLMFANLANEIKTAFNKKFFDTTSAMYGAGVQTELSVPLQWGLVQEKYIQRVADNLARRVRLDNTQLDVGLLGTKAILNALSENGHADLAFELAANDDYPSWGWWIRNGATTLYENWPIDAKSDISLNHIMFGEIGAWLYKGPGGIKPDPAHPGFKNTLLEPHFVKGLDSFQVEFLSPYGHLHSSWKRHGKKITYTVTVPPNATASLKLPGKETLQLNAGKHTFTVDGKRK